MPSARCATRSRLRSSNAGVRRALPGRRADGRPQLGDELRPAGRGQPPRVVAHITFDWPTWSQTSYRRWYVDEVLDQLPAIEMEIVFRVQRLDRAADAGRRAERHAARRSPLIGDGRLERAGHDGRDHLRRRAARGTAEYAIEVTYEGLYELAEETLADGASTLLDEHFGALGGWIAAIARQARRPEARLPPRRRDRPTEPSLSPGIARIGRCPTSSCSR